MRAHTHSLSGLSNYYFLLFCGEEAAGRQARVERTHEKTAAKRSNDLRYESLAPRALYTACSSITHVTASSERLPQSSRRQHPNHALHPSPAGQMEEQCFRVFLVLFKLPLTVTTQTVRGCITQTITLTLPTPPFHLK